MSNHERIPEEEIMSLPEELKQFAKIEGKNYANGSEHVYGTDDQGRKVHISHDAVLEAYGYGPKDQPPKPVDAPVPVDTPVEGPADDDPTTPAKSTPVDHHAELFKEFSEAVRDESQTFMVTNPETGQMEKRRAKDLTFSEWIKAVELRERARWETWVRPFAEVPEGEIGDLGNGDAAEALANREHAMQLNAREGRPNPTEDDIALYRRLHQHKGEGEGERDDHDEPPQEKEPTIELPPELQERLSVTRDRFARLSAERRGLILGIRNRRELAEARQEYVDTITSVGNYSQAAMEAAGMTEDEIEAARVLGGVVEHSLQYSAIYEHQMRIADGKILAPLYRWWARQGGKFFSKKGIIGAFKKAGVMAVPGLVIGGVAGVASSFVLGPLGGAVIGAGISRAVSRGLMGAHMSNEADAVSVSFEQNRQQMEKANQSIVNKSARGEQITAEDLVAGSDTLTERGIRRNRGRTIGAVVIGAASGTLGAVAGSHIFGDHGGGTPKGGVPKDIPPRNPVSRAPYDPQIHRLEGIASDRPEAVQAFGHMVETAPKGPGNNPFLDAAYESASSRMTEEHRVVLDHVIGRLSGVQGYGNNWTAAHMQRLAEMANDGMSDTEIIGEVMSGKVQ